MNLLQDPLVYYPTEAQLIKKDDLSISHTVCLLSPLAVIYQIVHRTYIIVSMGSGFRARGKISRLSQFQNVPFRPISALVENFNPRNMH
jgi:hypothetical protein